MKLLIMQLSPTSYHFIPLRSKYFPQHPVLKHPDRSTQVRNLFVAVGNAELTISNSMALYTTGQKAFAFKTFNISGGSCVAVEVISSFSVRVAPPRDPTGLLSSLKKQEVCVIDMRRVVNVAHLFVWKVCDGWAHTYLAKLLSAETFLLKPKTIWFCKKARC
jgi:hypothetical protein